MSQRAWNRPYGRTTGADDRRRTRRPRQGGLPPWRALERWADADLRSLNAQIEFLLRRALQDAGRLRKEKSKP